MQFVFGLQCMSGNPGLGLDGTLVQEFPDIPLLQLPFAVPLPWLALQMRLVFYNSGTQCTTLASLVNKTCLPAEAQASSQL